MTTCNTAGDGATHHTACDCREAARAEEVARLKAALRTACAGWEGAINVIAYEDPDDIDGESEEAREVLAECIAVLAKEPA